MKKLIFGLICAFILSLSITPSLAQAHEPIEVRMKSESAAVGNKIKLRVETNLPKKTKFFAVITGPNKYEKEIKLKVKRKGLLKKKVRRLEDGTYTIKYQSYKPEKQPRKVRKKIGENGDNLEGNLVNDKSVVKYTEKITVNKSEDEKRKSEESLKKEAEASAEKTPAAPGKILYTKGKYDFTGVKYYFEGEIVATTVVDSKKAWLVKNKVGYVMPIISDVVYDEANVGDKVKVWGTLTGDGYQASDFGVENVVGMTGSMILVQVNINGVDKI